RQSPRARCPDEILGPKAPLLLQTELPPAENIKLLERAKALGTKTVMNLAPSIEMTKKTLKNIDYLIVNHDEAKKLATQLDLRVENNALRMAEGFAKLGELHCIVTLGKRGAIAVTPDLIMWEAPAMELEEVIDHNGAEDAYCGVFAACIYNNIPFARALKRAGVAGSLACLKEGVQDSFPYFDDIEKHLGSVDDPRQVKL
ncbi:MAG: PfkB family carbohydrate kinase, partial [Alphaproteobacteria bacterium]|nr:PfkB family carbohydrate kinase [Alphaproteobacteria bacterium]